MAQGGLSGTAQLSQSGTSTATGANFVPWTKALGSVIASPGKLASPKTKASKLAGRPGMQDKLPANLALRAQNIEAKCSPDVRRAFRSKPVEKCSCATITAVWSACDTFWEIDTTHSGAITRQVYMDFLRYICPSVNTLRMLRRARLECRFRSSAVPVRLEDFLAMVWPTATIEDRAKMLRWAELREIDNEDENDDGTSRSWPFSGSPSAVAAMAMDRLNRSRRDKLDWAAKLGLGPLAGGEAVPGQGPVPGNAKEAQTQRKQAEEMAELRRRIDEKQAEVASTKPPQAEEEVDASGFLNPNAKASGKKKAAPKSVLELRIGQKPTVVVTSRPDDEPPPGPADQEPGEEKDEKDLKAERRAKQKAATRFQDVEEEYSLDSQGRENRRGRKKKRRAGRLLEEEDSDERRYRSRSGPAGRLSEDPYGRDRGDRSRSYDRYYDDDDDSSEIRRRKRQKEKRLREEWRKEWKKKKEMDKRRAGGRSSDEESGDLEKRADGSAERSPGRQLLSKKEIGVPEAQVDHVGGVQRKYVGQLRDSELDERLRRAELALYGGGGRKLLTEAEAIALLQGGNKRRRCGNLLSGFVPADVCRVTEAANLLPECYDIISHRFSATDQDLEKLFTLLCGPPMKPGEPQKVLASELSRSRILPRDVVVGFAKERHLKEVAFDYEEFKSIAWPKLKERWVCA
ncbi:unnamed protein product [Symbiodinium microadriaticum]|nr:unnamed protein product [Symbiodinium microadriaticum]